MLTCMRTIIDVRDEVIRSLDTICAAENRSRASVVREALTEYLTRKQAPASDEAFGIWKGKDAKDGLVFQQDLRDEWDQG